jgi:hypothetical protein
MCAFAFVLAVACSGHAQDRTLASDALVEIQGSDSLGDRVSIVWAPDGGDIVTSQDGIRDEMWFWGDLVVHKDAFGGVVVAHDDYYTMRDRLVLEGKLLGRPVTQQTFLGNGASYGVVTTITPPISFQVMLQSGKLRQAQDIFSPEFQDGYATEWTNASGVRFTASTRPRVASHFPSAPRSSWDHAVSRDVSVTASIQGFPVDVVVDTAEGGLAVTQGLARHVNAETRQWAGSMFALTMEKPETLVLLRDVVIGGTHVDVVPARVVPGEKSVLYAGVDVFPRASLAIGRGGRAEVTTRSCRDGVPVVLGRNRVIILGVKAEGDSSWPPMRELLIDTAFPGRPTLLEPSQFPLSGASHGQEHGLPDGAIPTGCRPGSRAELSRDGRVIASDDAFCNATLPQLNVGWNALAGPRSFAGSEVLVDLKHASVCWPKS